MCGCVVALPDAAATRRASPGRRRTAALRVNARRRRPRSTRKTHPAARRCAGVSVCMRTCTAFGAMTSNPIIRGNTVYLQDSDLERLRTRRAKRRAALEAHLRRAERRPERAHDLGLAHLRRHRHDGVRTRRGDRATALVAPAREPVRAVRRHRADRRPRPRVRQHAGLPAGRPRRPLRTLGRDRPDRLALPDDQGAVGASRDERRRRRLVPGQRRRARQRVRGHRESRPVGWVESVPERRLVPRPCALHRLARRARRSHGQAPLVRPGDAARRARLRLRGVADPRDRRRSRDVVFGAGKGGRVVAWDRAARTRLWSRAVGTHLHDLGPLPVQPTRVCPGLLGGVQTPMAYADGRLFVPVVELCSRESAVTLEERVRAVARAREGNGVRARCGEPGRPSGRGSSARPRSAVRRSRATPSSFPPTTGASPRSRRPTAARSGTRSSAPATTAVRPSARTSSSSRPERSIRGIAHPVTEVVAYSP